MNVEVSKSDTRILCIAIHIFLLFTRKVPFTKFSMMLAAALTHYIAAKIEYRHPKIVFYEQYFHEKAPTGKKLKGKK